MKQLKSGTGPDDDKAALCTHLESRAGRQPRWPLAGALRREENPLGHMWLESVSRPHRCRAERSESAHVPVTRWRLAARARWGGGMDWEVVGEIWLAGEGGCECLFFYF